MEIYDLIRRKCREIRGGGAKDSNFLICGAGIGLRHFRLKRKTSFRPPNERRYQASKSLKDERTRLPVPRGTTYGRNFLRLEVLPLPSAACDPFLARRKTSPIHKIK